MNANSPSLLFHGWRFWILSSIAEQRPSQTIVCDGFVSPSSWRTGVLHEEMVIDWSTCPDVECVPGRMSGVPVVRGTRIPVEAVLVNAADYTPEQIVTEIYPSLPLKQARRIISFAKLHEPAA